MNTDGGSCCIVLIVCLSLLCVFSELYEHHCNTNTGKVLFTAAKTLCQMLEADVPMVLPNNIDLPAVIHALACQAVTVCHPGKEHECSKPSLQVKTAPIQLML